jgi:hypothetical protein
LNNIIPPIFIVEDEDVIILASIAKAQSWIEPIDVQLGGFEMYDSVGRLLKIETFRWRGNKITSLEEQPTHQKELEHALRRYLKASNVPQAHDPSCDLPCLVEACRVPFGN